MMHSPKKIKRRRPGLWLLGGLALLLFAGSLVLAHRSNLLISEVMVVGAKTISDRAVSERAQQSLSGNYFWLYPKRHVWWYSPARLTAAVGQSFPELASVVVRPLDATRLELAVVERRGRYLYCVDR